jgi:hypothetical protein
MRSAPHRLAPLAAVLLCVAVAAAVLAGCASSDPSDQRLSKRAYIEQAGALQEDAAEVFRTLDGKLPATKAQAAPRLAALDALVEGYGTLHPPRSWQDEHDQIVTALRDMRSALKIVSTLSARRRQAIATQVGRYQDAQARYDAAIRSINASR